MPLLKTFSDHSFLVSVRSERAVISSKGTTEVPASETRGGEQGAGSSSRREGASVASASGAPEQGSDGGHEDPPRQRLTCSPQNLTRPRAEQTPQVSNACGNRLIQKEVDELSLGYTLTLRAGPSLYVITKKMTASTRKVLRF